MEICVLGAVSVSTGTRRIEISASKVRTLLAVLALNAGRTISCTTLADELWSDQPPPKMGNALQASATRLRKVLDDASGRTGSTSVLRATYNGYLLDVVPESVDCLRFERLAAEGRKVLPWCPKHAIELFESALQLWRGSALADAGDGLLCRGASARLEESRLMLWEDLISARIIVSEARQVLADLRQFVEQYPLRERFCEQMMVALYRTGHQGAALEAFHRTRRHLDQELGLEPGPFLRRRYQEILAQDPRLMAPDIMTRWQDDLVS
jgi:SARP family transcriptional regulator, regulator of embCAB operon